MEALLRAKHQLLKAGLPKAPACPRSLPWAEQQPGPPRCAPATDTGTAQNIFYLHMSRLMFSNSENYLLSLALSFMSMESTTCLARLSFLFLRIFHFLHI